MVWDISIRWRDEETQLNKIIHNDGKFVRGTLQGHNSKHY
jgi:hypothetical protein